jgi:hypothetical protein
VKGAKRRRTRPSQPEPTVGPGQPTNTKTHDGRDSLSARRVEEAAGHRRQTTTQAQACMHASTQACKHAHTQRQTDTSHTHRDRQTHQQTDRQTDRQTGRQTAEQTDRQQTCRWAGRQTERERTAQWRVDILLTLDAIKARADIKGAKCIFFPAVGRSVGDSRVARRVAVATADHRVAKPPRARRQACMQARMPRRVHFVRVDKTQTHTQSARQRQREGEGGLAPSKQCVRTQERKNRKNGETARAFTATARTHRPLALLEAPPPTVA